MSLHKDRSKKNSFGVQELGTLRLYLHLADQRISMVLPRGYCPRQVVLPPQYKRMLEDIMSPNWETAHDLWECGHNVGVSENGIYHGHPWYIIIVYDHEWPQNQILLVEKMRNHKVLCIITCHFKTNLCQSRQSFASSRWISHAPVLHKPEKWCCTDTIEVS